MIARGGLYVRLQKSRPRTALRVVCDTLGMEVKCVWDMEPCRGSF